MKAINHVTDSNGISSESSARAIGPRLRLAMEWTGLFSAGYGLWGVRDDCGELHEEGGGAPGSKCVVGAVGTSIAFIFAAHDSYDMFGELARDFILQKKIEAGQMFAGMQLPQDLGNGPFAMTAADQRTKRSDLVDQLENDMSTKLGKGVRHIGVWDGSTPGSPKKRDDEVEAWPVFGMERDGQEFHVAYMGRRNETGEHLFRMGHGPGIETEGNLSRLKARHAFLYNDQWFDRGGLDFFGRSDIMGDSNSPDVQPDLNNPETYQWIYEQVNCYTEGGSYEALRHHGLWFQVYDASGDHGGTVAAGAVAAFGPDTPSIIRWMSIEGSIPASDECSSIGPWKE